VWLGSHDTFWNFGIRFISSEQLKTETSYLVRKTPVWAQPSLDGVCPLWPARKTPHCGPSPLWMECVHSDLLERRPSGPSPLWMGSVHSDLLERRPSPVLPYRVVSSHYRWCRRITLCCVDLRASQGRGQLNWMNEYDWRLSCRHWWRDCVVHMLCGVQQAPDNTGNWMCSGSLNVLQYSHWTIMTSCVTRLRGVTM